MLSSRLPQLISLASLILTCSTAAASGELSPVGPAAQARHRVGVNLAGMGSYSTQRIFVDAFMAARAWIPQREGNDEWDTGEKLTTDANGWVSELSPGQYATTVIGDGVDAYPAGKYVMLYKGEGDFSLWGIGEELERTPGRVLFEKLPDSGIYLTITKTTVGNHLRDIHIVPVESEATFASRPFYAPFISQLTTPFGTLRFMDLMNTNESKISKWSDRSTKTHFSQATPRGLAYEYIVQISNRLQRHPWVTIPHLADEDYVVRLAKLMDKGLNPDLQIYVEYSNEVWNGMFGQAEWAQQRGLALGLDEDPFKAQIKFYSQQASKMINTFKAALSPQRKVVRVLGSMAVSPGVSELILTHKDAYKRADALAIAPYFGHSYGHPDNVEATKALGVDGILEKLRGEVNSEVRQAMVQQVKVAKKYGVRPVAYEGGQHLAGIFGAENDDALTELFAKVNRDERMGQIYYQYLTNWRSAGGEEFLLFTLTEGFSKWGNWGLYESYGHPTPKATATQKYMKNTPGWLIP